MCPFLFFVFSESVVCPVPDAWTYLLLSFLFFLLPVKMAFIKAVILVFVLLCFFSFVCFSSTGVCLVFVVCMLHVCFPTFSRFV